MTEQLDRVRQAYETAAEAWSDGAELAYRPMADALIARAPDPAGCRVVDVGAGTGAVSASLAARGAQVIAVDASWPMLAHAADERPPSAAGDILRLPFASAALDGAAAAFVLNHLGDPVAGLTEMARVVRPGGFVLASVFSIADRPPAKAAIDGALVRAGWEPPAWYRYMKEVDGAVGSAVTMRAAAESAGFSAVDVLEAPVATGVTDPEEIVRFRLSQPQVGDFLRGLDSAARAQVVRECVDAIVATGQPLVPGVVMLVAIV